MYHLHTNKMLSLCDLSLGCLAQDSMLLHLTLDKDS